ncbi:MAG: cysteine desulfurase [Prevotella sp.]|nr:cysteine desulfurase [Prevotella sp.]
MIDIKNIDGSGLEDPTFEMLRQVARKYCPEELSTAVHSYAEEEEADPIKAFLKLSELSEINSHTGGEGNGLQRLGEAELSSLNYEEADTLNSDQIKADFPVLNQKVNGHDLVWLDNGATTQKPNQVIDKISEYYRTYNSNIHRGAHTLAARATDAYEKARETVARFINAPSAENIVFVRGTTEGINLIAQTFGRQYVTPGDNIIVSTLDHHANIVPWQQVAHEQGAELRAIPIDRNGDLILSELERLITPRTRIVSVGHVNNTFGTINDVERIIQIAHSHNVPVLIDGAQSIAHTKVDVQQLGADFFVFSGHKIYGPNGIGAVYGRKEWLDKLRPWQGGGNMIKDVTIERTEYNEPPARFEAGTPNVADAIGLGEALDYVSRVGIRNIEQHEHRLTEYAREQLAGVPGLTLIGNPKHRVSVVSFVLDSVPVTETGTLLDKEGIAVRAGHHCAQPALRALGYEASVRPTFAIYNTKEDVDRLVVALHKIVGERR